MKEIGDIVREMREFADTDSQSVGRDVLRRKIQHFADRIKVAVAKMETTTPTCQEYRQVGDRMLDLLNRVHDFLGKLCRDGRCDDHCSECIDASDLADDVWDLIQSCKEPLQVGNAAAMYEALKAVVKVGYPYNFQHEAPHISGYCYEITTAIDKCFAALAAPPRNCDVFEGHTVEDEFEKAMGFPPPKTADEKDEIMRENWFLFKLWLYAEAKGEAK